MLFTRDDLNRMNILLEKVASCISAFISQTTIEAHTVLCKILFKSILKIPNKILFESI